MDDHSAQLVRVLTRESDDYATTLKALRELDITKEETIATGKLRTMMTTGGLDEPDKTFVTEENSDPELLDYDDVSSMCTEDEVVLLGALEARDLCETEVPEVLVEMQTQRRKTW